MATKITAQARAELVGALRNRYQNGTHEEKNRILNEFMTVTGYHRRHAIRVLNGVEELAEPAARRGRPRLYDEAARQALITLWKPSDRICGKRLKPLLSVLVAALERHKHLQLDSEVHAQSLRMSVASIDRLLRDTRAVVRPSRRRRGRASVAAQRAGANVCGLEGTRIGKHRDGFDGALR